MRKVHSNHGRDHHPLFGSDPITFQAACSYAFASTETETLAATSQTIADYDEAYAFGPAFSIDGDNKIVVETPGVYLAMAVVSFPLAMTEEANAGVRIDPLDLTPPDGTLVPGALGFWSYSAITPDAAGDFFRNVQPMLPFALATDADVPATVEIDLNKANSTSRAVSAAVYVIRLGEARTS